MSKLFELLQETAKQHNRTGLLGICILRVNEHGRLAVRIEGQTVATGRDEAELIAKLSAKLANEQKAAA